jgi:hypothetical protein
MASRVNNWRSWITPAALSLAIGVAATAAVLRSDVGRHEKAIEALQAESRRNENTLTRIDERCKNIERDVAEILERQRN